MKIFCACLCLLFASVLSEVITILDSENITCLLTKQSVYSALYIWPPIYHENGSMVNIKRPIAKIDDWGFDDWNTVNTTDYKSCFAPITDIRWETYDLMTTSFAIEPSVSVSACSANHVNNSLLLTKDLFFSTAVEKTTNGKEFCKWTHYSVSKDIIVKNVQDSTWEEWRQSGNNSDFDNYVSLANNIVKFHKNQFRFCETETTHLGKRSYINLGNLNNSTSLCISMFVAVDKLCQLDVTIESNKRTIYNKTVDGFNDVFSSAIKYWKRVEVSVNNYSGSGRVYFFRRKPYKAYDCFWAVDYVHLCRPEIDIYQIPRPRNSRQDYVCRTLDERNLNRSVFCNQTKYLGKDCSLKCEDVMGDTYLFCEGHKICLENGDCKCSPGSKNSSCLFSQILRSVNETDANIDDHKSCTACYSIKELIFYIFLALLVQFFIGCIYYMYKNNWQYCSFMKVCFSRSELSSEEVELSQREQLLGATQITTSKICILEDFEKYINTIISEGCSKLIETFPFETDDRSCIVAMHPENFRTEDYNTNIIALNSTPSRNGCNYKNTTFINGCFLRKTYIVYEESVYSEDFWKMIKEEEIETIVVASNYYEMLIYMKDLLFANAIGFNPKITEYYDTVSFKTNNYPKEIFFHYIKWNSEDKKYLYPNNILPVVKLIFEHSKRSTAPIVIQSRKGNNLPGTLILCDLALQMAETENKIDFSKLLEHIRKQKPNIITDKNDYILGHLTVFEFLLEQPSLFMKAPEDNLKNDVMEKQKTIINKLCDIDKVLTSCTAQDKNISSSLSVFADGYRYLNQFLLARQPNKTSIKKFWSRVAEEGIKCVLFVDLPKDRLWPFSNTDDFPKITVKKSVDHFFHNFYYHLNKVSLHVLYRQGNVTSFDEVGLFELQTKSEFGVLMTVCEMLRIFPGRRILLSYRKSIENTLLTVALYYLLSKYEREHTFDVSSAFRNVRKLNPDFKIKTNHLAFIYNSLSQYLETKDNLLNHLAKQ